MTLVTVFRHVPKPITGMIGTLYDPEFEKFEANLDWLETTGVLVERFDPSTAQQEVAKRPAVQQIVSADGDRCLPLILVNESVLSRGTYLSRAQLARTVGQGQGWERSAA
jgi:Arsenical resistance operon protein ArsD